MNVLNRRERGQCGFTLLELITVMAIVAIMLGAAITSYYGVGESARMAGTLNSIRSTLTLARQRAVLKGQAFEVVFNEEGGKHFYVVSNRVENIQVGEKQYLPAGVGFEAVSGDLPVSIVFRAGGGGVHAPLELRVIQAYGAGAWRIGISPLTGLVSFRDDSD